MNSATTTLSRSARKVRKAKKYGRASTPAVSFRDGMDSLLRCGSKLFESLAGGDLFSRLLGGSAGARAEFLAAIVLHYAQLHRKSLLVLRPFLLYQCVHRLWTSAGLQKFLQSALMIGNRERLGGLPS